jgi:hypothetical protein
MPRNFSPELKALLAQPWCESHSTLAIYVEPESNSGTTASLIPYYLSTAAITVDGLPYQARLSKDAGSALLRQSLGVSNDRAEIAIEDADGAMRAEFAQWGSAIQGAKVELGRAWRNLDTGQWHHYTLMRGIIHQPSYNSRTIQLSIISEHYAGGSVGGGRVVTRPCEFTFPNPDKGIVGRECGYSGSLRTCNKLYDDAGGCSGRSNQHRYGGFIQLAGVNATNGANGLAPAPVFTSPSFTDGGAASGVLATDTATLQAKIDVLNALGGGTLQLRGEEYKANLTLKDKVRIVGAGIGRTIISSTTNAPILKVGTTAFNAAVVDLTIKGSVSAGGSQIGLEVEGTGEYWGFEARNLWIQDCGDHGLWLGDNPFSVVVDNIHVSNCADYPYLIYAPNNPGVVLRNCYAHTLRSGATVGFRIKAGRVLLDNCNGTDNVPVISGTRWAVIGRKNGVDGDSTDSGADVELRHCNIESFDDYGLLVYHASSININGITHFAGTGNANQVGIQFDLAGDGSAYFSQYLPFGTLADTVNFADGNTAYKNSQPIHANGFAPIQTAGQGPYAGGPANPKIGTFYNDTTSKAERLPRADGGRQIRTVTATTTISPAAAPELILCNHTAAIDVTLPNALWFARASYSIEIKDISSAGASTYNINLKATGGTVEKVSTYTFAVSGGGLVLQPDGSSNWMIVGGSTCVPLFDDAGNGRVTNVRRYAAPTTAISAPAFSFTDQYGLGMTRIADRIMGFATETTTGAGGVEALRIDGSSGSVFNLFSGMVGALSDATIDIGQSGNYRFRDAHFSRSVKSAGVTVSSGSEPISFSRSKNAPNAYTSIDSVSTFLNAGTSYGIHEGHTVYTSTKTNYNVYGFSVAMYTGIVDEGSPTATPLTVGFQILTDTANGASVTKAIGLYIPQLAGGTKVGIEDLSGGAWRNQTGFLVIGDSDFSQAQARLKSTASSRAAIVVEAASGDTSTTDNFINKNGSGTATMSITANGAIKPASLADSAAPNGSIYYSTTASKLVFKDSGGTVNNLY